MKKIMFSLSSFIVGGIFWFFESAVHYYLYGELEFEIIPQDFNELWMRIVILLLIVFIGIFADTFSRKILIKEKQLEASRIYSSMVTAIHHILNNLLNKLQFFKMEALKNKGFDQNIIKLYDDSINQASDLVERLSNIEHITDDDIAASVDPNNVAKKAINHAT